MSLPECLQNFYHSGDWIEF